MIETLISIWLVSWLITHFEPLNMVLELLPDKLFWNLIRLLLTCLKCVSFWLTFIWTGSILFATALAFISFWYDKLIGPIERKVRL